MTCNSSLKSPNYVQVKSSRLTEPWVIQVTSLFPTLIETNNCSSHSSFAIAIIFLRFSSISTLKQSFMKTFGDAGYVEVSLQYICTKFCLLFWTLIQFMKFFCYPNRIPMSLWAINWAIQLYLSWSWESVIIAKGCIRCCVVSAYTTQHKVPLWLGIHHSIPEAKTTRKLSNLTWYNTINPPYHEALAI